jgi:hypothetical protein
MDAIIFLAPIRYPHGSLRNSSSSEVPLVPLTNCLRRTQKQIDWSASTACPFLYSPDRPWQQDSVQLWKQVVSNPLLQRTNVILFLNKIDIFQKKLNAGIRFGDYVTSYGDRENDFETATSCK